MHYLLIVSCLWAFSFGLIGNALKGVDSLFVAGCRLSIALLVFLPLLRLRKIGGHDRLRLFLCGAVQFGVMYVCYIKAFSYLPSHLVALFSVLTPVYVVLIHDLRRLKFHPGYLVAALLSVVGAGVIRAKDMAVDDIWTGFALMQAAGLAFGFGQVYYRDWKRQHSGIKDQEVFAILTLGGATLAWIASIFLADWGDLPVRLEQWGVLLYLGAIASGFGFFLWNKGAALSKPGTLGAFNNMVVPLAVIASLFVFGEAKDASSEQITRLAIGAVLIGVGVWIGQRK
ncbi:MAG: EamA family transporter [Coraliomargarita sp.]